MAEAVIFTGLQGAGKTTYFTEHYAATHAHVIRDVLGTAQKEAAIMLLRTAKQFEAPTPEEGFDEIRTISATKSG